MKSQFSTGVLSRSGAYPARPLRELILVRLWGVIQWPWLLRSLWGGRQAHKIALLDRLDLPHDSLPHLGSWKADTWFLWRIVETIERLRPSEVVELGCGASSLIIARALERNGGGKLTSFDQDAEFVVQTGQWLAGLGLAASIRHAPIVADPNAWSHCWYDLSGVPTKIDLLVIDGPPWALNPFGRGRAEVLFDRIGPGGMILLDDALRPGERVVAARWRRRWPNFSFRLLGGAKGTLVGERLN